MLARRRLRNKDRKETEGKMSGYFALIEQSTPCYATEIWSVRIACAPSFCVTKLSNPQEMNDMPKTRIRRAIIAGGIALAVTVVPQAGAQASIDTATVLPDSTMIRTYLTTPSGTGVGITVCGTSPGISGCSAAFNGANGSLGPFGKVGPIVEGNRSFISTTNTVNRYIYALDLAVNGGTGVSLLVYRLSETISSANWNISFKLIKTIPLGITGGTTAKGFMAANKGYVYIGTDQSPYVMKVAKTGYALAQLQTTYPTSGNISGITVNGGGYVSLSSGLYTGTVYDPNGNDLGGPGDTVLNTAIGETPRGGPAGSATSMMHLRYTKPGQPAATGH
jgi:hypothetical protein